MLEDDSVEKLSKKVEGVAFVVQSLRKKST